LNRIWQQIDIDDMQFGFMKGKGTIDAIFIVRQMQEKFRAKGTHTHTTVLLLLWNMSGTTRVSRYQKGKTRKGKPIWIYWSKR